MYNNSMKSHNYLINSAIISQLQERKYGLYAVCLHEMIGESYSFPNCFILLAKNSEFTRFFMIVNTTVRLRLLVK